ncbi:hypothetical protein PHMEG_00015023 [Phytophthora megakarya]|uniref:Uncharacterized protein n=1 Tax=Phytophthora megakarya TaxID=4795 RepID=A0A225W2W5_9STRA|nr:hypothetical protein PHMEG_00015023 [Phytophthora megakarya]
MWANHKMRNLNRSTWTQAVMDPPLSQVAHMLRAPDFHIEQQLTDLSRSTNMVLEALTNSELSLEFIWVTLDSIEQSLESRKSTIEAFIRDLPLPPAQDVIDPPERLVNVEDTENQA